MYDLNTAKLIFVAMELQNKLKRGIIPFSKVNDGNYQEVGDLLIYDDKNDLNTENKVLLQEGEYQPKFRIVLDSCVDEFHHDIISFYDDMLSGLKIELTVFDDQEGIVTICDNMFYLDISEESLYLTNE